MACVAPIYCCTCIFWDTPCFCVACTCLLASIFCALHCVYHWIIVLPISHFAVLTYLCTYLMCTCVCCILVHVQVVKSDAFVCCVFLCFGLVAVLKIFFCCVIHLLCTLLHFSVVQSTTMYSLHLCFICVCIALCTRLCTYALLVVHLPSSLYVHPCAVVLFYDPCIYLHMLSTVCLLCALYC